MSAPLVGGVQGNDPKFGDKRAASSSPYIPDEVARRGVDPAVPQEGGFHKGCGAKEAWRLL